VQNRIAEIAPNVISVRTASVLKAARQILGKAGAGLAVVAIISLLVSLLVLVSVMAAGRSRQIYDATTLHSLGVRLATTKPSLQLEYLLLALITSVFAVVLGSAIALPLLELRLKLPAADLTGFGVIVGLLFDSDTGLTNLTQIKHGRSNRPAVAIGLCLISMTLFTLQDSFIKWLATDYWLIQLLFVRSVIVVIGSGAYISLSQGRKGFVTHRPGAHAIRTTFNFVAFVAYYMAVTQLPLANATCIALTAPLFMTALAGPLLGEPVGIKRQMMLSMGFIGVLFVIQPTANDLNIEGSLYAITGAFMFSLLAIQTRKMSKSENSELMVFYAAFSFMIVTGIAMLFYWETPDPFSLGLMIVLGIITLFAQYTITHAYQFARVHIIAPFEYITVVWAILIGWIVFNEPPQSSMLYGAILIVSAGVAISWYEKVEYNRNTARPIEPG
jgi:drug/metabolite transporter (DMT)-like permease